MARSSSLLVACAAFLVALAGCGGGDSDREEKFVIATVGDSITSGAPGWDPNPDIREQFGANDPESQWQHWAQVELGDRHEFRNCGVSGERTDGIATRLETCIEGADLVILQGGINDLVQRHPPEAVAGNLKAMVDRVRAAGLPVLVANVLPVNRPYPGIQPKITEVNRLIDDLGATVIDFHRLLERPAGSGRLPPEWVADGLHPSVEGYRRLGGAVAVAVAAARSSRV